MHPTRFETLTTNVIVLLIDGLALAVFTAALLLWAGVKAGAI